MDKKNTPQSQHILTKNFGTDVSIFYYDILKSVPGARSPEATHRVTTDLRQTTGPPFCFEEDQNVY